MKIPLLDELVDAEAIWRNITSSRHPMFGEIPVEHATPNPKHQRHWMFATNDEKIMAHVYKPDYVLDKFEKIITPFFSKAYGFGIAKGEIKEHAKQAVHDTFVYLLFHELFHSVYCPKSKTDLEKFDVALKDGIKAAEPGLSPRDLMNKVGNVRNSMWDYLIDTFFTHFSTTRSDLSEDLQREIAKREFKIGQNELKDLPDGIVTTWDMLELADNPPQTLFYPITRAMYALIHCRDSTLRGNVFKYFRNTIKNNIRDDPLEKTITDTFKGTVKYLSDIELAGLKIIRDEFIEAADQLYKNKDKAIGEKYRTLVARAITEINTRPELRYKSVKGIIEPLSKYINTQKEEKRDGAYTEPQEGDGEQGDGSNGSQQENGEGQQQDSQTPTSQSGGGAEQALQSMINQGDGDVDAMLPSIANDNSSPQTARNKRITNLAKDEYYKRNAAELPVKSPTVSAETKVSGYVKAPVKVSERMLTPDQLHELPWDQIMQFELETGLNPLIKLSEFQWIYEIYEWKETPIMDYDYKKTGIILPENIIFRVDGSGSMDSGSSHGAYVGTKNRYDSLMHVVYGITKSVSKAAKQMGKKINVVTVSYSNSGRTRVSKPIELLKFYDTPNNDAKKILLNPDFGSTYHDIPAYQEAHKRCVPGKTVEIIVTDGDLDSNHDDSMSEIKQILTNEDNMMAYFSIFHEGEFAQRINRLAATKNNLTYHPYASFNEIQSTANEIIIQRQKKAV